jgi:hypothetical protein
MTSAIYVVVSSDDLCEPYRSTELAENPERKPNPIVWETNINNATLEQAQRAAASIEARYGACRIGRVVFEDNPAFHAEESK